MPVRHGEGEGTALLRFRCHGDGAPGTVQQGATDAQPHAQALREWVQLHEALEYPLLVLRLDADARISHPHREHATTYKVIHRDGAAHRKLIRIQHQYLN